jgi:hypothetical protein
LKTLYGPIDEFRGYQLQNKFMILDPKKFDNIENYITKVNDLREKFKACNIDKNIQLIYNSLKKIGPDCVAFVYSFHNHRLIIASTYTKPSLASFSNILMHEQKNLILMGFIKSSKSQALLASEVKESITIDK